MKDTTRIEEAQATREARDSVAASPSSHGSDAVESAMRRYLGAEQYHEQHARGEEPDGASEPR